MFFRYDIFIFINKGYLILNFSIVKVVDFSKNFCYHRLFLDLFYPNMLCVPFYVAYYNDFFVSYFFKELGVLFLMYNFYTSMIFS